MIAAYINYPNTHITIHADPTCGNIRQQQKSQQRSVLMTVSNISKELKCLEDGRYRFASEKDFNDMWIELDFNDPDFERSVIGYIRKILARRYKPFDKIIINEHC